MAVALLCSSTSLEDELGQTVLWRPDIERRYARSAEDAWTIGQQAQPRIAVVDSTVVADVRALVTGLREHPRHLSIVVLARADSDAVEADLLAAGANAVLPVPPGAEGKERLARLISVPPRRATELPMSFQVASPESPGGQVGLATLLSLSVNGALIECDHPLRLGDVLDLHFRLPAPGAGVIACARVVRLAAPRFGVEFYGLEERGRSDVARFVAAGAPPAADH